MATNAKEFYAEAVTSLPPQERLRLAALILDDLANNVAEFSDAWSEADMQDLVAFSLSHSGHCLPPVFPR